MKEKAKKNKTTKSSKKDIVSNKKKRILLTCLFIILAVLTIFAVTSSNKSFSLSTFIDFVKTSNPIFLVLAFTSVILFIMFEGLAIRSIASSFGYKKSVADGIVYSSADIYFSAITPSATGGQPMSAYFMYKDGIPGTIITITLLYNLMMYSSSFIIMGIITFLISPSILLDMNLLSIILVLLGVVVQLVIFIGFYFLLYNDSLLEQICLFGIKIGVKLHIVKDEEEKINRLKDVMHEYKEYALIIKSKKGLWIKALIYNALQRFAQVAVVLFVFLATHGNIQDMFSIWAVQLYVIFGAYCVPIPGGMGVSDYLMLDGYNNLMNASQAANLQLLSRTISFYCCIIICGIIVLVRYLYVRRGKRV